MDGEHGDGAAERRGGKRRATQIPAVLKDSDGSTWKATIDEISDEGCSIAVQHDNLVLERIYSIKFAHLEMQAGFITWTDDGRAGMQFLAPLYAAVVDDIVGRFPPPQAA